MNKFDAFACRLFLERSTDPCRTMAQLIKISIKRLEFGAHERKLHAVTCVHTWEVNSLFVAHVKSASYRFQLCNSSMLLFVCVFFSSDVGKIEGGGFHSARFRCVSHAQDALPADVNHWRRRGWSAFWREKCRWNGLEAVSPFTARTTESAIKAIRSPCRLQSLRILATPL